MIATRSLLLLVLSISVIAIAQNGQHQHSEPAQELGSVHFPELVHAKAMLAKASSAALPANTPTQSSVPDEPNNILNIYDAFGYGKRGTILDWASDDKLSRISGPDLFLKYFFGGVRRPGTLKR
jgi:hypothetical protein